MKLPPLDTERLGVESVDIEIKDRPGCVHRFEYTSATAIKCMQCHVGFYIGMNDRLINGHLYHGTDLIL